MGWITVTQAFDARTAATAKVNTETIQAYVECSSERGERYTRIHMSNFNLDVCETSETLGKLIAKAEHAERRAQMAGWTAEFDSYAKQLEDRIFALVTGVEP